MPTMATSKQLYSTAIEALAKRPEQVGFFLADFEERTELFTLSDWWAVPPEGYEHQTGYHVTLSDEAQGEAIRWAWNAKACLVEVHSHGPLEPAQFSPTDLAGFVDWVPHVRWRLRGRPYAAIVVASRTADALAWTVADQQIAGVDELRLDDGAVIRFTGETIGQLGRVARRRDG
jgi:hypothetical protein